MPYTTNGLTRISDELRKGKVSQLGAIRRGACVGASVERDRTLRLAETMLGKAGDAFRAAVLELGVRQVLGISGE